MMRKGPRRISIFLPRVSIKQYNKIKLIVKMIILRFVYLYIFGYIWNDFLLDVIFVYYAESVLTHFNEFRYFIIFPFYQC